MPILTGTGNRIVLALAAGAVALALAAGLYVQHLRHENGRLTGLNKSLAERVASLTIEAKAVARANSVFTKRERAAVLNQKATHAKIKAVAPDWAGQRVPDAVLDALGVRDPSTAAPVATGPSVGRGDTSPEPFEPCHEC